MEATTSIQLPKIVKDDEIDVAVGGILPQLYGMTVPANHYLKIIKKEQGVDSQPTNQKTDGFDISADQAIAPPVDIITARSLKDISPHHSSCIQSKKYSIMGLGFVSEGSEVDKTRNDSTTPVDQVQQQMASLLMGEAYVETEVDKALNPLTIYGFAFELYRAVEDFLDAGTGYLEAVRDSGNKIIGLNWLPYEDIEACIVKDDSGKSRLVYKYLGGTLGGTTRYYALFGVENKKWVFEHFYSQKTEDGIEASGGVTIDQISEVIPLMIPSNQSRYYGYPDWLSASTMVTLLSRALQYKSDFYTNKGVLSYILSLVGQVDAEVWNDIKKKVQGSVGGGQNFRNLVIKLSGENAKVQVDKLAGTEKTEDQFARDAETFNTMIVSGHRVPPVLANILISGKLGAANETVQALIAFQLLCVGPYQNMIQRVLASTLGNKTDGVKGLKPEDFRLRKITSQFNIQGLDTASRMREEAPAAKNPDGTPRDVSQGLKK